MIRIGALNDEGSRCSEDDIIQPKEPSQEVQEENALKSYNEALQEQRNGNLDKAVSIYRQLLDSNLLLKVKPDNETQKLRNCDNVCSLYAKPSLMLKYSCLKNMGVISQTRNDLDSALDYYTQALDIEGTDVSVWYKAGLIALKLSYVTVACDFFYKGLECSPKHWLCLDNIITCLFVLCDFIHCLHYIAQAFSMDSNYTRGHVVRDQIFFEQPSIAKDVKLYFPNINLYEDKVIGVKEEVKDRLRKQVLEIRTRYCEKVRSQLKSEPKEKEHFAPDKSLETATWSALGDYILYLHEELSNEKTTASFFSPINLKIALSEIDVSAEENPESDRGDVGNKEDQVKNSQGDQGSGKDHNDEGEKKPKKGRGSALMEELLWGGKRRSARVRSSLRGNPEPMDVAEALRRILPRKLLHKTKIKTDQQPADPHGILDENSMDTMDLYRLFERQESAEERRQKEELERSEVEHDIDQIVEGEKYFGTKAEVADIVAFIERNDNKTIIDLIKCYILELETQWKRTWPNLLPSMYIKCYQIMKKYYQTDCKVCCDESDLRQLAREAGSILLYGELSLEHNSSNRNLNQAHPKEETNLQISFMQHTMELVERNYLFESDEKYFEFSARLYWLRCHLFLLKGQTNLAIATLNELLSSYDLYPDCASTVITLKNNRKNNVISKSIVEEFLVFQSRKRSLAEVVRLYEDGSYQELTEILKETFTSGQDNVGNQFKDQENELVSRQTQLSMLINGLYHLNEYKECLYWLESSCYELLQKAPPSGYYGPPEVDEEEESWMIALDRFLIAMEDCLTLGNLTLDEALPHSRVSRFVQTLCHAICKELEDSDRPPCPARPWLMLNRILIDIEKANKEESASVGGEEEDENDIPSSVLILFTAHEYLGRREWCNCNDSALLYVIMDQVIPNIRNPDWASFRETIQQHLEQVVYCLYQHPNKRAKARYLTDHNVVSVPLTWKRGIQLFDLFRPDETPSYDSLRINLIGSETEVLFRRIAALIPDESDPVQNSEEMLNFIVGKRNDVPVARVKLPRTVKDLFYILGDYYFKTHESAKAVNYLLIDLCANPDRVDSWASMALSRASILEQQLNSCDPIRDEVFLQDALSALRCYEHCLQLDSNQSALWIEYGTFVYTIHSFCSQRMKLESHSLGMEKFEELETTKNKMLDTAKQAFVNANLIWYEMKEESERQDERWLHHYMLGKISEKHGDLSYFDHYEKAAQLLYENEAEYPSKIGYTTPQTLAIEALEVYYRIHVCVIKTLEVSEGKPLDSKTRQIFNKYLELVGNGHFVNQMSKSELAKMKAKEAEIAAQNTKRMKVVEDLVDEMIAKIEGDEKEEKANEVVGCEMMDVIEDDVSNAKASSSSSSERRRSSDSSLKESESKRFKDESGDVVRVRTDGKPRDKMSKPQTMKKCESESSDRGCYITLDDLKNQAQPPKKKRRASHVSLSSSSCGSDDVKYDDESSSSSSSTDSSDSTPSTSSSSKGSSGSGEGGKAKASDGERKTKASESTPDEASTPETADAEDKCSPIPDKTEDDMLGRCLSALEICAIRFPQHYKSVYRLAHFYFRSKEHRDLNKCRDLLLGRYQTPNGTITGLFADRKNTNFFNGIWRIPAGDVDRPGSFASHMSRSVLLLMEVLRDLKDHKMLLELCLQLRKVPEPDKKYLREDERNQLSVQAINLSVKTLRINVKESTVMTLPIVLDSYRCYQKVQKHYPSRESVFGEILLDAFKRLGKGDKCTLEQAIKFCQSEICTPKNKVPRNANSVATSQPRPKQPKAKKEEKRKVTPKPQSAAKPIVKQSKQSKKAIEWKKKPVINMSYNNPLADPACLSFVMKNATANAAEIMKRIELSKDVEVIKKVTASQTYADILRKAALSVKKSDKAMDKKAAADAATTLLDQMNIDYGHKLIMEQLKLVSDPSLFAFPNYPVDFSGDYFKQYNSIYNSALMGNYLSQLQQGYRKPKAKAAKSRAVMKPRHQQQQHQQQQESSTKSTSGASTTTTTTTMTTTVSTTSPTTGTSTNFNIDDILAKPSTSTSKARSPNVLTPSQIYMSIEDKIKSAFSDLDGPNEQMEAMNLSPVRKKHAASDEPEVSVSSVKRPCRDGKAEDIEVVVIDD